MAVLAVLTLCSCTGGRQAASNGAKSDDPVDQAIPVAMPTAHESHDGAADERFSDPSPAAGPGGKSSGRGRLSVTVEWPGAPAEFRRPAGRSPCGGLRRVPLGIHTLGGVRDAVVWLNRLDGREAASKSSPGRPGALSLRDCRLEPRVVLMDGGDLLVRSHSEQRERVVVRPLVGDVSTSKVKAREVLADFWLPVVGVGVALPMTEPGIWQVHSKRDPVASSYVVVANHGFFATPDDRGVARLDRVPAGRYQLVAWHPPIRAGQAAVEIRREVTVEADKTGRIKIAMTAP